MRQPQRHDSLWAVGRALQLIAENTKNVGEMAACHFFVVFILNKPIILLVALEKRQRFSRRGGQHGSVLVSLFDGRSAPCED
jgi:hypothetical protein